MEIKSPEDSHVVLPVGLYTPGESVIDDAEVRELNGFDEEALSRSTSMGHALQAILERAVVKIGDVEPNRALLDQITAADRIELLLRIRILTWGPEAEFTQVTCPECEQIIDITIDLDKVPRKELTDKANDRFWEVPLRKGVAHLSQPSGELHRKTLMSTKETAAEMTTWFIADCVNEVEDSIAVGPALGRGMGVADRRAVMNSIGEHAVGPLLEEVKATCPKCLTEIPFPLVLVALFPL